MTSSDTRDRALWPYVALALVVFLFSSGLAIPHVHTIRVQPQGDNYFKLLALAFAQGQLDVNPAGNSLHDLVLYHGKYYLYWPPVPGLVYLPLVAIWGSSTPDPLINALLNVFNAVVMLRLLQRLAARYAIPLSPAITWGLAFFWALGTVNFYMSLSGAVWHISQLMAQSFLLLALYFMARDEHSRDVWLSGLCFGLACYTRNNLIFSIFALVALYAGRTNRRWLRDGAIFVLPFVVLSLANLAYNHARFGSVFENGIRYHQMAPEFRADFERYGYFSLHYLWPNFLREVLWPPPLISRYPFLAFDPNGFGFVWASPLFLLLPVAVGLLAVELWQPSVASRELRVLLVGAVASAVCIAGLIFSIMGNGWQQFGARYTLDFHVFALIALLLVFKRWPLVGLWRAGVVLAIALSVYINFAGVLLYYRLG